MAVRSQTAPVHSSYTTQNLFRSNFDPRRWLAFAGITCDLFRDLGASPEAHDSRVIWVRSSEPGPGARELLLLFTYQFTCVCVCVHTSIYVLLYMMKTNFAFLLVQESPPPLRRDIGARGDAPTQTNGNHGRRSQPAGVQQALDWLVP